MSICTGAMYTYSIFFIILKKALDLTHPNMSTKIEFLGSTNDQSVCLLNKKKKKHCIQIFSTLLSGILQEEHDSRCLMIKI